MSIPTSLTRGNVVFARNAELAIAAQEAEKTAKNPFFGRVNRIYNSAAQAKKCR